MHTISNSNKSTGCVADALGLGTLADGDDGGKDEILIALYAHARNEDGKRVCFENDSTFRRGWVNLDAPKASELVSTYVALDDEDTVKRARRAAQTNLEAVAWNDLLNISQPPIRCRIKIHGNKWGLRFQSPGIRGRELVNEQLPKATKTLAAHSVEEKLHNETADEKKATEVCCAPENQTRSLAAAALKAGGFPE